MDAEFFNTYVNKLKSLNNELINKNLILETQLELAQKQLQELQLPLEQEPKKKPKTSDTF
jgi:transcription elongation factor GreA-like protein